jgi:hypothetical protein
MAIIILGGLVTSTLLSLFIMPSLYLQFGSVDHGLARFEQEPGYQQEHRDGSQTDQTGAPGRLSLILTQLGGGIRMRQSHLWLVALLMIVCLQLAACAQTPAISAYTNNGGITINGPARLERLPGTNLSRVILTAQATKRLGIELAPVRDEMVSGTLRKVIPYSALLYDQRGQGWVYTNPAPLTYLRSLISVDHIDGDLAVLSSGPPSGTEIVTVGISELFGTEFQGGLQP